LVVLRGAQPAPVVRELLGKATVFVLASCTGHDGDLDGIPVVLMEAMGAGVACVSTRVSGIPELISCPEEGLLVEEKDRVFGMGIPAWVSLPATVLWLVACANAMNLFDGMDGLASGLSLFVSLALLALAGYQGKAEIAVVSAVLAGASLGFLLYNFPPAVIFLGDTGSLFLGMTLGVLAIEGSFKSHLAFALVVPVIALGLPILDTLLAIMRRVSRRVSVFSADKEHIHHRLVAFGFTRKQALILLYALSVILASVSLLTAFSGSVWAGGLIILAGGAIVLMARILGASEVREFGAFVLRKLGLRRAVDVSRGDGVAVSARNDDDGGEVCSRKQRIAFLTPLPTPYRQPLLEKLVDGDDYEMVVYYFTASESDRSWHVPIPQDDSRFRVLPVRSLSFMGRKSFINHWNPGLWRELDKGGYDLVVIPGYALLSSQLAILWAWIRRKPYVIHSESHLAEPRSWLRRAVKAIFVRRVVSHSPGHPSHQTDSSHLRKQPAREPLREAKPMPEYPSRKPGPSPPPAAPPPGS